MQEPFTPDPQRDTVPASPAKEYQPITEPLMVPKGMQPLYKTEEDRERLEANRRPKPKYMKELADVVEMCIQTMIDGMLDGGSHFTLIDTMNALQIERDELPIQTAFAGGHKFVIVGMPKRVPVPIYWASQQWSLDVKDAHQFNNFKSLVYWRSKVFTRYERILQMLLTARRKELDGTTNAG